MSKPTINSAIKDLGSFKDPRHFSGTMSEAHHFKRLLNVFKDYLKNDLGLEETNADYIEIINIDNDIQNAFDNLNNLRDELKKNPSNQSLKDKVKNAIDDYNKKIQAKITILLKLQDKFEKRLKNAGTNTSINKNNAQKKLANIKKLIDMQQKHILSDKDIAKQIANITGRKNTGISTNNLQKLSSNDLRNLILSLTQKISDIQNSILSQNKKINQLMSSKSLQPHTAPVPVTTASGTIIPVAPAVPTIPSQTGVSIRDDELHQKVNSLISNVSTIKGMPADIKSEIQTIKANFESGKQSMNNSLKDLKNKIDTLTASGAVNKDTKDKLDELARGIAAIQTLKINNVQKIAQNLKNEFTRSQTVDTANIIGKLNELEQKMIASNFSQNQIAKIETLKKEIKNGQVNATKLANIVNKALEKKQTNIKAQLNKLTTDMAAIPKDPKNYTSDIASIKSEQEELKQLITALSTQVGSTNLLAEIQKLLDNKLKSLPVSASGISAPSVSSLPSNFVAKNSPIPFPDYVKKDIGKDIRNSFNKNICNTSMDSLLKTAFDDIMKIIYAYYKKEYKNINPINDIKKIIESKNINSNINNNADLQPIKNIIDKLADDNERVCLMYYYDDVYMKDIYDFDDANPEFGKSSTINKALNKFKNMTYSMKLLDVATMIGSSELIVYFLSLGANPSITNGNGKDSSFQLIYNQCLFYQGKSQSAIDYSIIPEKICEILSLLAFNGGIDLSKPAIIIQSYNFSGTSSPYITNSLCELSRTCNIIELRKILYFVLFYNNNKTFFTNINEVNKPFGFTPLYYVLTNKELKLDDKLQILNLMMQNGADNSIKPSSKNIFYKNGLNVSSISTTCALIKTLYPDTNAQNKILKILNLPTSVPIPATAPPAPAAVAAAAPAPSAASAIAPPAPASVAAPAPSAAPAAAVAPAGVVPAAAAVIGVDDQIRMIRALLVIQGELIKKILQNGVQDDKLAEQLVNALNKIGALGNTDPDISTSIATAKATGTSLLNTIIKKKTGSTASTGTASTGTASTGTASTGTASTGTASTSAPPVVNNKKLGTVLDRTATAAAVIAAAAASGK